MSWSGELAPGLAWPTITGSAHYLPYLAEAAAKQPAGASAKCSPDKGSWWGSIYDVRSVSWSGSRRGPDVASNHKKATPEGSPKKKTEVFCGVLNVAIRPLDVRQKATEKARRAQSFLIGGGLGGEGGERTGCLRSIVRPRLRPRGSRFCSRRDRRIQTGFSRLAPFFLEEHGVAKIEQQGHIIVGHKCKPHVPAKYPLRQSTLTWFL
ncbi:hypothetical protein OPV22_025437 [Ensete ventricosum]|uniref:Uncharacterized protein n=1 Tax=Ensete ventricosum TaxID=4639 RepID=A0AAV8QJ89_ENSVE|nr:hypothetical protein OPV22_025437 [Ensete ventricosum]